MSLALLTESLATVLFLGQPVALAAPDAPAAPVEVVEMDFDTMSIAHVAIYGGLTSPNRDFSIGWDGGVALEVAPAYPYFLRGSVGYGEAASASKFVPIGRRQTLTFGIDVLTYRGRAGVFGYVGVGVSMTTNTYNIERVSADSLYETFGVMEVDITNNTGYRVFMGLRFSERWLVETSYQFNGAVMVYRRDLGDGRFSLQERDASFSVARVMVGYIFSLGPGPRGGES